MDILRKGFDMFYSAVRPIVFRMTKGDPEAAHRLFISLCNHLYDAGGEGPILDNVTNTVHIPFELSNAAGLNKNGDIPPSTLYCMGFDRVVVGTVTNDPWDGNPKPRTRRFPKTGSMVNWMGLPGIGAKEVAKKLYSYGDHGVPITINLMSTPEKSGDDVLRDLEGTMLALRNNFYVDRFELNISCPNTHGSGGAIDARAEYQSRLDEMLSVVESLLLRDQTYDLKLSPDLDENGIADILDISADHSVTGFTVTNTTTDHDPRYIPDSPGKGGASGNAVYIPSLNTQRMLKAEIDDRGLDHRIIACGGINSPERVRERVAEGASGIQIYTPLIFSGPRIVRKLRQYS